MSKNFLLILALFLGQLFISKYNALALSKKSTKSVKSLTAAKYNSAQKSGINIQINIDKTFFANKNENTVFSIEGLGNVTMKQIDSKGGYAFGSGINYEINDNLQAGLEATYRTNTTKTDAIYHAHEIVSNSIKKVIYVGIANIQYNFNLSCIDSYIGFGAGLSKLELNFEDRNSDIVLKKHIPAAQIRFGAETNITSNITLAAGYKLFATKKIDGSDLTDNFNYTKNIIKFSPPIKNVEHSIEMTIRLHI